MNGKFELYQGDCLQVMKQFPDNYFDACITDPPYGTTACSWDEVIPFEPMWERLHRIVKPNGAIALFGSEPFSSKLRMSNLENYKYDWIWKKGRSSGFIHAKNKPMKDHENIMVFSTGTTVHKTQSKNRMVYNPQMSLGNAYKKKITQVNTGKLNHAPSKSNLDFVGTVNINTGERYPTQVIKFSMHNVGNVHPTQKPVALMKYLIQTYTNAGEIVIDFTMGSGTTGVACAQLGRRFVGIELDPDYFEIARKRIENAYAQPTLFEPVAEQPQIEQNKLL